MSFTASKIPVPASAAYLDLHYPFPPSTTNHTSPDDINNKQEPSTILTPHTLPPPTRKSLLNHLQSTSSISLLNDLLTTTLTKAITTTNPAGAAEWSSRVHALALELLRSGTCAPTFPDLMSEITRRALEPLEPPPAYMDTVLREKGGVMRGPGGRVGTIVLPNGSYGEDGLPDVRVAGIVVETGVGFLEERVKGSVEIVDGYKEREEKEEREEEDEEREEEEVREEEEEREEEDERKSRLEMDRYG